MTDDTEPTPSGWRLASYEEALCAHGPSWNKVSVLDDGSLYVLNTFYPLASVAIPGDAVRALLADHDKRSGNPNRAELLERVRAEYTRWENSTDGDGRDDAAKTLLAIGRILAGEGMVD